MLKTLLYKIIKETQFNTPFRRYFFPRFPYNFSASQLCFLCQCIEDTKQVKGSIAEIGCADGQTTVFLNNFMDAQSIDKKYYAIDTFSGFITDDIAFEVEHRGKTKNLFTGWQPNSKKWFDSTMRQNNIRRVISIEADVNNYPLAQLGDLSFVLLDVDLYRPMIKSLRELYDALSPDGIIVVDDCNPNNVQWDGSDQAYKEFMKEIKKPIEVVHGKLGIIKKKPI